MPKSPQRWFPQPSSASWWIVLIAGGLVVVFTIAIGREVLRGRQVRQQVDRLQEQVASEQTRQQQLDDLITYLSSETYKEREARLKLGLRKPGERVLVVPDANTLNSNSSGDANSGSTTGQGESQSLPQRWWDFFFGDPSLHKSAENT